MAQQVNGVKAPQVVPLRQGPFGFVQEYREPVLFLGYGESNTGKSTDLIYTFPNGYFIGPRGGPTKTALSVVGWLPQNDEGQIDTLEKLVQRLPEIARSGCDAIIVDDLSVLAERSRRLMEPSVKAAHQNNSYAIWAYIADCLFVLRDECRKLNLHVGMNAHPMGAWVDNEGVRWKGGPWLPGRVAPIHFPPVCDVVLRAVRSQLSDALPFEWQALYKNDPMDLDWYAKDRLDVCWAETPMNLREILTADGRYKLSRAPGLEWQDEVVERVTQYVLQGNAFNAVWQWAASTLVAPRVASFPVHLRGQLALWTRRDARARIKIRERRAQRSKEVGVQ